MNRRAELAIEIQGFAASADRPVGFASYLIRQRQLLPSANKATRWALCRLRPGRVASWVGAVEGEGLRGQIVPDQTVMNR
jgi:hypothetical protein